MNTEHTDGALCLYMNVQCCRYSTTDAKPRLSSTCTCAYVHFLNNALKQFSCHQTIKTNVSFTDKMFFKGF
jgi:hypothetical protein